MSFIRRIAASLKTKVFGSVNRRPLRVKLDRPIFSFTFDDVPQSAVFNAAPLLEIARSRGTFYVCGSFACGASSQVGRLDSETFAVTSQLQHLASRDHQIGCHTWSHLDFTRCDSAEFLADAERNRHWLQETIAPQASDHFAFPFGGMSLDAKKLVGPSYKTLRSTRAGVNFCSADAHCLLAVPIYSDSLDRAQISALIRKAVRKRGWLIFYTHGVEDSPNRFGTTIEDLSAIVNECRATGGDILTLAAAHRRISGEVEPVAEQKTHRAA